MVNRPEIKVYPMEFYPHDSGHGHHETNPMDNRATSERDWQERQRRARDVDQYIRGLLGKHVTVLTSSARKGSSPYSRTAQGGIFTGVLETVLSEAVIIRSEQGQALIYDWAIVAIESR
ncbi:MAG: hypothetical protein ACLQUY_22685 [Ktedonobacterales bacterium]